MRWRHLLLVLAFSLGLTIPVSAGIFFHRKETPTHAARHVSELLGTIKADPDTGKRMAAVEALRQYDAKTYPEIAAVLIDVLQHDVKAEVRAEAAASLGKLRPVAVEVGQALDQALATDPSSKVRWQARTALWHYHLSGYRSPREEGPPIGLPTNKEPPLAAPTPTAAPVEVKVVPSVPPTAPRIAPVPSNWTAAPQPMPAGPMRSPLVPTEPPALKSPPPTDASGGPSLTPPG